VGQQKVNNCILDCRHDDAAASTFAARPFSDYLGEPPQR
jgi:hypothetical protein